jgi:hypothetical protein
MDLQEAAAHLVENQQIRDLYVNQLGFLGKAVIKNNCRSILFGR